MTSDRMRPKADWGALAGDVTGDRTLIWSRADRPARMLVEWSTTESFEDVRRVLGPHALEDSDFDVAGAAHRPPRRTPRAGR